MVLAALVLGLSVALWGAVRARHSAAAQAVLRRAADDQRAVAQANAKKARDEADRLLATQREIYYLLSFQAEDGSTAPPQVLDFMSARADGRTMRQHPEAEAPIRTALGMAYLRQGRWVDAEKQLRRGR